MMETTKLAAAIERDLLRDDAPTRTDITKCFVCRTGMMTRGGRFCSDRCRSAYDSGFPAAGQDWLWAKSGPLIVIAGPPGYRLDPRAFPELRVRNTATGRKISCAGCGKEFDSKGLRCCSVECERRYNEGIKNREIMAEVGAEPAPKRQCIECGGRIPMFRKGRRVPSKLQFCSDKCRRRHRRANPSDDRQID